MKDLWTVQNVIHLVDPNYTDRFIWKLAFDDETFIKRGFEYYGYNGGTIHQLIDLIQKDQEKLGYKGGLYNEKFNPF